MSMQCGRLSSVPCTAAKWRGARMARVTLKPLPVVALAPAPLPLCLPPECSPISPNLSPVCQPFRRCDEPHCGKLLSGIASRNRAVWLLG